MLEYAIAHKEALQAVRLKVLDDPNFFWFEQGVYVELEKDLDSSTWSKIQKVSLCDGEVIGYLSASISRADQSVTQIAAANFTKEISVTFSRDFRDFLSSLLEHYRFHKVSWSVIVGNPAEAMYDKVVEHHGGRIVGQWREDIVMRDGRRYDEKWYEILRSDYVRSKVAASGHAETVA